MRAKEFLIEYNRQKTADNVGPALIMALANDRSVNLPPFLNSLKLKVQGLGRMDPAKYAGVIKPDQLKDNINAVLAAIEQQDPTPNKEYTPWLARMYAKAGGGLAIEDMNRGDLLGAFHTAKKRRMIKPEHSDINRFKYYQDFEDAMEHHYNNFEDLDADLRPEGKATKVYNDENVTIIVPEDEAAACKYGRGTRWCTASTRGQNYFDSYNRMGKLYILIPKKPKYEGEKYQIHFASNSYMDENDDPVDGNWLLTQRFPELLKFFIKIEPELENKIVFANDQELQEAIESVAEIVQEMVWEKINEWESDDDYYHRYLRDEGYVDDDGEIDFDRAPSYTEYNEHADRWARDMWNAVTPSPDELKEIMQKDQYAYRDFDSMKQLPDVIGIMLEEKYRNDRDYGDQGIAKFLQRNVSMKRAGGRWQAYIAR